MANREVIGKDREFHITILGRLLEHLGTQMYKQRAVAIAELVANSWDAGAENVYIELPPVKDFDRFVSELVVTDDGVGMDPDHIDERYLVIGRNRRKEGENYAGDRPVMGRKGIGKLAGFGIAAEMTVLTWRDERATEFTLNINDLKKDAGVVGEVPIAGTVGAIPDSFGHSTGTKIILRTLKHKTPLEPDKLQIALARRFSRRTRGEMKIFVNGELVGDPQIELEERHPKENYELATLSDGSEITYYYGFAKETIKERELRGFTIYTRGKTAQAPPFFFDVEATAWGQHGTKYLTGEVNADFLDDGIDDESDLIATDRQQIDWEDDRTHPLNDWGRSLTNKILRERSTRKGKEMEKEILAVADFSARINRLDPPSQKQIRALLRTVGESEPDPARKHSLADSLVKAFEYRHFHDVVQEIESVSDNPEGLHQLLTQLYQWKVLESRAILEVVRGRVEIIKKFHEMIVNDAPETSQGGSDNMHDLLAEYPWLLNPEWQVLIEEKSISRILQDWNLTEAEDTEARRRIDFLALTDERRLIIVEIKRAGHPVSLKELQRLEKYKDDLSKGDDRELSMLLVHGGTINVSASTLKSWQDREDGSIVEWRSLYSRTLRYYQHYEAVLTGEVEDPGFSRKEREVVRTRTVLETGTVHRGPEIRKQGLGSQDVDYLDTAKPSPEAVAQPPQDED